MSKRDHRTAFRPIGDAAAATDALKDEDDQMQVDNTAVIAGQEQKQQKQNNDENDDGEPLEHPVEEIESLCMQCGENVGRLYSFLAFCWMDNDADTFAFVFSLN